MYTRSLPGRRSRKIAWDFVEHVVGRYGVLSALSRTRMMQHEYAHKRGRNRVPLWLLYAIELLETKAQGLEQ